MIITKERTRLIFTEFTPAEKSYLEEIVSSMDTVFMYIDPDGKMLGLPTGMEKTVKKLFPKATFIDKSDEYWPYANIHPVTHNAKPRNQLQIDFINFVIENSKKKQKLAGILSTGVGKPIVNYAHIPTPTGYKLMGDIEVGDEVFGSDGKAHTVTHVFPQGKIDIYEVKFADGRIVYAGRDHLWTVYSGDEAATMTTEEIMNSDKHWAVPVVSNPVEFNRRDISIDPYTIGAYLVSGCTSQPYLSILSKNDYVAEEIAFMNHITFKKNGSKYTFYKGEEMVDVEDFFEDLPQITMFGNEIPTEYMYNDPLHRLDLLRGMLDAAGEIKYYNKHVEIQLRNVSTMFLKQVQFIINSFGGQSIMSMNSNGYESILHILVPNKFKPKLFTIPWKRKLMSILSHFKDDIDYNKLGIQSITLHRKDEATCITVDTDDHLFLANDFVVTHNTFMSCYSAIEVGQRTLIIAPTSSIKQQWADTLTGMFNVKPENVLLVNSPSQFVNVSKDFVVVSQASLASLNKKYNLEKIMKDNKFGIKVIDEVQMWFRNIVDVDSNCNIANNWYITGTFGRSGEQENRIYQEMFGDLAIFREKEKTPTIFNRKPGNVYGMKPYINVNMVWTHSGLSKEEIKSVMTSIRYSEREGKWMRFGISVPAYLELVIPSDKKMTKYLNTLLKVVKKAYKEVPNGKMLILTSTIAASETIAYYVRQLFPDKVVNVYNASVPSADREPMKKNSDILVSTTASAGTGFDMKGLTKLLLAAPIKSWILTTQITGRLRRNKDANGNDIECYEWDLVDADIGQLRAWANARADVYKRISKRFKVIDM